MIRSIFIITICSLSFINNLFSQSLPPFFQYSNYKNFANPAIPFDGYNGHHNFNLSLSHRVESAGELNEGPNAQVINATWIPFNKNRFRLLFGGAIVKRQFGPTNFTDVFFRLGAINYSSPGLGKISAAINLGFNQFGINASETRGLAPQDPLLNNNYADGAPNLGAGIYYKSETILDRYKFVLGLSIPQIGAFDLTSYSVLDASISNEINPQIYGVFGLNIYQGEFSHWELLSWIKKHSDAQLIIDFMGKYHLKEPALWVGAGVSSDKNLRAEFGFKLNYFGKKRYIRSQNKQHYFLLGFAYNFHWGNIPNQLNNGLELKISWLLPQV